MRSRDESGGGIGSGYRRWCCMDAFAYHGGVDYWILCADLGSARVPSPPSVGELRGPQTRSWRWPQPARHGDARMMLGWPRAPRTWARCLVRRALFNIVYAAALVLKS
eukprot:4858389-Prymnesium_polylepis.1